MRKISFQRCVTLCSSMLLVLSLVAYAQETKTRTTMHPSVSIMEVMQKVITPATNTLWGVDNPQTDEDWLPLEEAALTTLVAADLTAFGGSGPQDDEWSQNPAYQAFSKAMQASTMAMLAAIRERDLDTMISNADALYSVCEGCHLQFNPGVISQ